MRYNRIWMIFALMAVVTVLGGCMDVQSLTDQERDLIAEYSAGVLLQHSDRYSRRLITREQALAQAEAAAAAEVTQPPARTEEADANDNVTETAIPDSSGSSDSGSPGKGGQSSSPDPPDSSGSKGRQISLNKLYHVDGLDFSYRSYQFCDEYPKGDLAATRAEKDETLLVVSFLVHNKSGKAKKVNLGKRNITYSLKVDGEEYFPGINILKNAGLNYLNTTIKKGGKEEAVLVYTMAREQRKAESISLQVKDGKNVAEVLLRQGGND